jgi:glutathione peroxidase
MSRFFTIALILLTLAVSCTPAAEAREPTAAPTTTTTTTKAAPLDLTVNDISGKPVDLKSYRGQAVLIVNVASECGYTPQYAELQQLYTKYQDRGLVILGFPSNDWGGQEPGDGAAIQKFASEEYGVTFPLFEKLHTTGKEMAPLYQTLTAQQGPVKWNFTKFLVDTTGVVVARFDSAVTPLSPQLTSAIEQVLPKKT